MKKKMKRLFAFLLASMMMFSTLTFTSSAAEEEYLMFLAYGGEANENAWDMCWANEADNTSGIEATTAMAKVGDTVTIGLKMPNEVFHTWYMAPVLVAEGVTDMAYTIDSITIDGKDVLGDVDLTIGDDEWWYEGTGSYTAEQSIRLKGGYNEWAAQAFTASPTGFTEIMYTITLESLTQSAPVSGTPTDMEMFLAYGGEANENAWDMCWANEADNASGIEATTAVANVGDTVTIGLKMPQEVYHTWYMAPVVIASDVTEFSYTIDSITIDGKEVLGDIDLTVGDDEWWYEGTGNYSSEESIRLKGGYNEWAAQAFATSPVGFTEIMYTITINSATAGSAAAGAPTPSTETYPAFIAIGGDKLESNDWGYGYAGEETAADGITVVNGELKNGETTTLSVSFDNPVVYTWYVAPCFTCDDTSVISEESTFDVKVYLDGVEVSTDLTAGKACWAEGTGSYAAEQCIRIGGGYNEWGDKYLAESPAGYSEIKFEITPNILIAAATAAEEPENAFDPNGTYHAYIGVQTPTWIFRNSWDDASYGKDSGCFDQMGFIDGEWIAQGGSFKDVEITGNGTYTVAVEGYDFSGQFNDAAILGEDGLFNLIFVSTDLPVRDDVVISNVVLKMDGKEITTMDEAFLDPDSKEIQKVLLANIWNNELAALPYYAAPTQSIEISFDVSGFANDAVVEEPVATEAPAAEPTEAPAADPTEAPVAAEPVEDGGSSAGSIVAVVVVVVVAAVAGVVVAKKKKGTDAKAE